MNVSPMHESPINDLALKRELDKVAERYRRLLWRTTLAAAWLVLAVAGLAALAVARGAGYAVPGVVLVLLVASALIVVPVLLSALRAVRDPLWVARRIEKRFPDLDARLLAALEQHPVGPNGRLGFLQQTVIAEAIEHARRYDWDTRLVPARKLAVARFAQWAMLLALAVTCASLLVDTWRRPSRGGWMLGGAAKNADGELAIKVEPEDTEVERGATLLVMARFAKRLPGDVQLLYRDGDGQSHQLPMSKSLDDPLFAARVPAVNKDMTYSVRYGDAQTRWYKVGVFDYPDLRQADATLKFPEYTGVPEKTVEDTRSVTAVEGTKATFTFRLNKAVKDAQLVPAKRQAAAAATGDLAPTSAPATAPVVSSPVQLAVDPSDPSVYSVAFDLKQSQSYRLRLVDDKGRKNKNETELVINVTANRPPELKLETPGHDVDVSALEELSVKAQVWDDFGVKRVGMSYGIAGAETKDVVLAEGVKGKEKKQVSQLLPLEQLGAEADQLLSYYLWVEDVGPDGKVRRTSGDMFFAEVRPFDQVFRQGQQPSASEQQQQQQQGMQNAQQAEQLAELQKQIINATWKVLRRELSATLTPQFVPDVKTISESQGSAKEQAEQLAEKLEDPKSKAHLATALKHMDKAREQFDLAGGGAAGKPPLAPAVKPLETALSSAQAAYQSLLKLRAREHEVVRGNQRQRQQGSQSSAANRRQRQLDQLDLENEQNRYETQRNASPQSEDPAQRETRQVMSRLKELAQRQEDLNRQMREMQSALQAAKDEQQREELKRQLARLRDQQQQMLRDADELRDRMDQPENQQRMADARQQLEDTRQNIRRASEELDKGQVPDAASAGARAGEQLKNLHDEFRKANAGQFNDAMDRMRQEARQLDQRQQDLAQQLNDIDKAKGPTLRDEAGGGRQEVAQGLGEQKKQLDKLLDDMKRTVEESEQSEPLLSSRLYDTIRDTRQQQPEQALDMSRQLLERGFVDQAKAAESDAGKGITKLRQGVEKAAESVLGDETEALRRARGELDRLARELEQEMRRNGGGELGAGRPATAPTTGPAARGDAIARRPTTREGQAGGERPEDGRDGQAPATQPDGELAQGENSRDGQRGGARPQDAQASARRPGQRGQQEGSRGAGEQGRQDPEGEGQRSDQGQQPGSQQARGGQQPGERQGQRGQRGQQGQRGQPGEQQDSQQADASRGDQQGDPSQQPGQQQGGQQQGGRQGRGQRGNQAAAARGGGLRQGGGQQRDPNAPPDGDLRQFVEGGATGPGGNERVAERAGPLTGEGFREWSDRLRDVEEMVSDPRMRAEAARIRERARSMRQDLTRHSLTPNWDVVRDFIGRPLVELRDQVSQELLKRESSEALVPIDREPVPPEYAEQVKRYYERLGSGK